MAGSLIQLNGRQKFEDGLRMEHLQEDSWCPVVTALPIKSDMARPLRLN